MKRRVRLILLIGTNGTGKSHTTRKFIKSELANDGRALIVNPDADDWLDVPRIDIYKAGRLENFNGVVRHIWNGIEDLEQLQKYRNGLLVFEDCRAYLNAGVNDDIRRFLVRRRQRKIDIIVATHGFTETPPAFFTFAEYIVLFKTGDTVERRKDVIKDYQYVKKVKNVVDKEALENPHYYQIIEY